MTTGNPNLIETQRAISETLRAHWRLFLFQGVIMIVLAVLAVAAPVLATIAVDIYVGWLFLISGVIGLVAMFSARNVPGFLWTFVTALLSVGTTSPAEAVQSKPTSNPNSLLKLHVTSFATGANATGRFMKCHPTLCSTRSSAMRSTPAKSLR
jgi:Short repeat of unknown function (DUF308)